MLRLFVLVNLLLLNLYACKGAYNYCIAKIKDSRTLQNNSLYIPIENNKVLSLSAWVIFKRSNNDSQAAILVSGKAAAWS